MATLDELMARLNTSESITDLSPFPGSKLLLFTPANEKERQIALGYGHERKDGKIEIFVDTKFNAEWYERFKKRVTGAIEEAPE